MGSSAMANTPNTSDVAGNFRKAGTYRLEKDRLRSEATNARNMARASRYSGERARVALATETSEESKRGYESETAAHMRGIAAEQLKQAQQHTWQELENTDQAKLRTDEMTSARDIRRGDAVRSRVLEEFNKGGWGRGALKTKAWTDALSPLIPNINMGYTRGKLTTDSLNKGSRKQRRKKR